MQKAGPYSILYLTRNGLLEPLGRSQVFSYLKGLSNDYSITLVTHEKPDDWRCADRMASARDACEAVGIQWLPQRFASRRSPIASAFSLIRLAWVTFRLQRRGRARLIHARSYLPAAVAWLMWWVTRTPFIFDMRALWPEEMITAGRLRRDSLLHRVLVGIERACLARSAAVVSLTNAAATHLQSEYPSVIGNKRIDVIPTCADLDHFSAAPTDPEAGARPRFGCCGTVISGWFRLTWLAAIYQALADRFPEAEFEIVTRDSRADVQARMAEAGFEVSRLSVYSARPEEMPSVLRKQTCNVMLYAGGEVSELGRSPTRLAEVLGCGRPVIANSGVGDVAEIVHRFRVGVLVESDHPDDIEFAISEIEDLLADPELPDRCRGAAEAEFSLEEGVRRYSKIYEEVLR